MQDSKNPRSTSDSLTPTATPNGTSTNERPPNGVSAPEAPPTTEEEIPRLTAPAEAAEPVSEPPPAPELPPVQPVIEQQKVDAVPPLPDLDDVLANRERSFAMQRRFMKTIVHFGWLFMRLLFWHWFMVKIIGQDRVMDSSLPRWRAYAREFSAFATDMGGVMIKLGQFVSTRADILPEEVLAELASLRDEVPGVPYAKIRKIILEELGPIENRFQWLDENAVAAASLGQVHRAKLLNGDRVVVKVLRPGIEEICYTDLAAMRVVAKVSMWFRFVRRRANSPALVDEFGRVLLEELSYKHEAQNALRFAEMFKNDMGVYIPLFYLEHSTDYVLTIEDVTSIKLNDYAALEKAGINRRAVAQRLMDVYLKQIFEEQFFHADPHPGNLFVYPLPVDDEAAYRENGNRPFYLIFIDFGMTGSLTKEISRGLIETLIAVLRADPRALVDSYVKLGLVMPDADLELLYEATELAFNQMWGLSMSEMSMMNYEQMAELGNEFNDLLYEMPFQMPQDFIYMSRTFSILSGMCTSLDPNFNPWRELQPYIRQLTTRGLIAAEESGNRVPVLNSLLSGNGAQALLEAGQLIGKQLNGRGRSEEILQRIERGELRMKSDLSAKHRRQLERIEAQTKQSTRAMIFAGLVVASTLLYINGTVAPAVVGYVLSGAALLSVLAARDG